MMRKSFEVLQEVATKTMTENLRIQQVIVVRTSQGELYSCLNQEVFSGDTSEEEALKSLLEGKQDTIVTELLCMWDSYQMDVPSKKFREMLITMNAANVNTKVLLAGKDCFHIKTLGSLQ